MKFARLTFSKRAPNAQLDLRVYKKALRKNQTRFGCAIGFFQTRFKRANAHER
jgi:hypothetical protein